MKHNIPLGALVEVVGLEPEDGKSNELNGLRLLVVRHGRDCDGTPLYTLSFKPLSVFQYWEQTIDMGGPLTSWNKACLSGMSDGGYAEDSLKVIRLP
jgi:hypothetical protein